MTLALTLATITFEGNGATSTFSVPFDIPHASNAQVIFTDVTAVQTTLTSTQYTLSGLGVANGCTITYPLSGSPIATGTLLTVSRELPLVQTTSLSEQGPTFASIESELDYEMMVIQQLQEELDRAIKINIADTDVPVPDLPPASLRAGGFLTFDSNGNPTVTSFVSGNVSVSSAWIPIIGAATTQAGVNLLNWQGALPNEVVRRLSAKLGDIVSVKDFGAQGDGSTDDTAAFNLALSNMGSGTLYVPAGTYVLSSTVTINSGQFITGTGPGSTNFHVSNLASGDTFVFSGQTPLGAGMSGFSIDTTTGTTRTGGRYIYNPGTALVIIENFAMEHASIGIEMQGVIEYIRNGSIRDTQPQFGKAILLSGGNDAFISNIVVDNPTAPCFAGLQMTNYSGGFVNQCDFIRCIYGVSLLAGTGQTINWVNFTDVDCDTCATNAWNIQTTGTGTVNGMVIENGWAASSSLDGVFVFGGGGFIDGVYLTNLRCFLNGGAGINLGGNLKNWVQIGGAVGGNGALEANVGIAIGCNVVTLDGVRVGPQATMADSQTTGIFLGAGLDFISITNCNLNTGNQALAFSTLGGNCIFKDNMGFKNQARGAAVIQQAASSATINHGLSIAPAISDIIINPTQNAALSGVTRWWVSATTATTFTISVDTTTTNQLFFAYVIGVQGAGLDFA